MEVKKQTKAEIKRLNDLKSQLMNTLDRRLNEFKNHYLQSSVDWEIKKKHATIKRLEKIESPTSNDLHAIENVKIQLERSALLALPIMVAANKSFEVKLENLVDKCIQYGIESRFMKVEKIGGGTNFDFSVLISDSIIEIHARFIFVVGDVQCPHFRFITTKRLK